MLRLEGEKLLQILLLLSCIASLISIFSYFIQRDGITGTC